MSFNVVLEQTSSLRIKLSAQILTKVQANLYELAQQNGFKGSLTEFLDSLNGVTFIPKVENGVLSWENNGDLPNPEPLVLLDPELENLIDHILMYG